MELKLLIKFITLEISLDNHYRNYYKILLIILIFLHQQMMMIIIIIVTKQHQVDF